MWGFIASGKTTICKTQTELQKLMMIYPYAKTKYFEYENQALDWIRQNQRGLYGTRVKQFGGTAVSGFIQIEYYIDGNNIYYNLDLKKFGLTRIIPDEKDGILVDNRAEFIKVKVLNTVLNNSLIAHHCIAIQRILNILGEFVDVDFILPDMSVYIALTNYRGKDVIIKRVHDYIVNRIGGVSYTVKDYKA